MSSSIKLLLAMLAIVIVGFGILYALLLSLPGNQPIPTRAPYTITGANGTINVPSAMHIEAFDPATNSNIEAINVWSEANHPSGARPVCQLTDGNSVNVDNSVDSGDGIIWIHISTATGCSGWVMSEFVTR